MKSRASLVLFFLAAAVAAAQDEIHPDENLVAEGIPPLPASIAEAVGPYVYASLDRRRLLE
jgi:hypothetical protein